MVALNIFHVLIAIAMVALVLVQRGAGATAGAAFGSGASGTVFGARGAGTFLTKSTWVLATLFCGISLVMAVMVSRMDASPETNLGVVASAPPVQETIEQEDGGKLSVGDQTDLPAVLNSQDEPGESLVPQSELLQEQIPDSGAAVDLPALDDSIESGTAAGADSEDS